MRNKLLIRPIMPSSHRRHGHEKTVLSCFVRVGGVNIDKSRLSTTDNFELFCPVLKCDEDYCVYTTHKTRQTFLQWWQIQITIWFKSWLNHWWWFELSTKDLIWKHVIWFGFDFILCDLIWWLEYITKFSSLGQGIVITLLALFLIIVPSLIFAETLTVRPAVHWWHFAHSRELLSFG